MFLHAAHLEFAHPISGEALAIDAPLPDDLAGFLAGLDAPAGAGRYGASLVSDAS
jgi:hypothetical protein